MKRTVKAHIEAIEEKCNTAETLLASERLRRVLNPDHGGLEAQADLAEARATLLRAVADHIGIIEEEDPKTADRVAKITAELAECLLRAQESAAQPVLAPEKRARPVRRRHSGVMAKAEPAHKTRKVS